MQYPFFDFLRSTLIPELRTDVSASTTSHAHFILITVSAFRTFPDKLMADAVLEGRQGMQTEETAEAVADAE